MGPLELGYRRAHQSRKEKFFKPVATCFVRRPTIKPEASHPPPPLPPPTAALPVRISRAEHPTAPDSIAMPAANFVFKKDTILRVISKKYGLSIFVLKSPSRLGYTVHVRNIAIAMLQTFLGYSTPKVGLIFNRDHSTVLHSLKRIQHNLDTNPKFLAEFYDTRKKVAAELLKNHGLATPDLRTPIDAPQDQAAD